jgi:hypothetical protein
MARHLEDAATGARTWIETPVTAEAHEWLDEPVELDAGVTLADLAGLLQASPLLQQVYRRFHAAATCAEAAKGPRSEPGRNPDDALEYLELKQYWGLDSVTRTYEPLHRLTLDAVGVVQYQDRPDRGCSAGKRIRYCVQGSPLRPLLALPLRVSPEVAVSEAGDSGYGRNIDCALHPHVTPGQVLHSVLWELSFFGPPGDETTAAVAARLAAAEQGPMQDFTPEEFMQWLDRP